MTEAYLFSKQTTLLLQVKSDLERFEPFKEYAYPHPASPIGSKYKNYPWGLIPAREILTRIGNINEEDGSPWSVGFGFTHSVGPDSNVSYITSVRKLERLVLEADQALHDVFAWYSAATFITKTVLINLVLNVGFKGMIGFKNVLAVIQAKNYVKAAQELQHSLWYKQNPKIAKELVERLRTQTIEPLYEAREKLR